MTIEKTVKAVCREIALRADNHEDRAGDSGDHASAQAHYASAQAMREIAEAISFSLLGTEDYSEKKEGGS